MYVCKMPFSFPTFPTCYFSFDDTLGSKERFRGLSHLGALFAL